MPKILITGVAGFIGMHLAKSLLEEDNEVFGIDNLDSYYDLKLKNDRLKILESFINFSFKKVDITNFNDLKFIFEESKPDRVINLAAQAGVRYSLQNPHAYINANIVGFMNILDLCRLYKIEGLIYASSSSVYGENKKNIFSVSDRVDKPMSIYAATKRSNELMARSYSHLYGLNTTGLRFFTVYGPWGRPDMALYIFTQKIIMGESITVFNNGDMQRDFTYIDDIISGIKLAINKNFSCEIFNLGNNRSENLMDVVKTLEKLLNKKAKIDFLDMQPGDVKRTYADILHSSSKLGFYPQTLIAQGLSKFIHWFKDYKNLK